MGIDIHRIAKIESLPRDHFCPFCQLLINPNEALQSVCGHLYCKPCLTYVASTTRMCPYDGYMVTEIYAKPLVESNKVLADTIGKTLVYCSYQSSGCTWVGSLADSSFHCYVCAFGNSLVMSSWCGTNIPHRQRQEHVQGAYPHASVATATTQASVAMATSQPNVQGHALASALMSQEQWYQQPYQQYYEDYVGGYMQQQPTLRQSFAPHNQVIYVQARPSVHYADQSQSLAIHQPHDAFPSPQDSMAHKAIGQHQSNQPHASWTIVQNPQSNQTNQVGVPPNNMIVYDQGHFPEKDQYTREMVVKYGEALAPESSDIYSSKQSCSNPSLPEQYRAADAVHNQMNDEGPSYSSHIAMKEHHQPINSIIGLQPNMNYFSATAPHVGLPTVKENDMQKIPKEIHWVSNGQDKVLHIYGNKDDEAVMEAPDSANTVYGINRGAEVTTAELDYKLKGKLTYGSDDYVHISNIVVDGSKIKSGPLDEQEVEENVENGWIDLGKSILVEKKGIDIDPSLDGTPLMNPTLFDQDGLRQLSNLQQHYLMITEKYGASSAGSLDRGIVDQRSLVRTQEKHEPGFKLRHALRSSQQPFMDLGEGQFRCGPRSPISEHHGVASHGYGPSGDRSDLHRSEFKGIANRQTAEKVLAADMMGPVDSNGLRFGDIGSQSRYTLQGYPGDHGGSFPGDWTTKPVENLDFHSQTTEHQQKSMDMASMIKHNEKTHKMAPSGSSQFGYQKKNEESRFKGSGYKEENRSIVHHQYS